MSTLPPNVAALLDTARGAHDPNEQDYARVHASLQQALAAAAVVTAGSVLSGASSAAAAKSATLSLAGKLMIGGALAVAGSAALLTMPSAPSAPRAPAHSAPAATRPAAAPAAPRALEQQPVAPTALEQQPVAPTALPKSEPDELPSSSAAMPPRKSERRANTTRSGVSARVQSAEPTNTTSNSQAAVAPAARSRDSELPLVRAALQALNRHAASEALALLQTHRDQYPQGALNVERDGLRAIARCMLDPNATARAERDAYLRRHPRSPLAARVRRSCDQEK